MLVRRFGGRVALVAVAASMLMPVLAAPALAADSAVGITKTTDLGGRPLEPGDAFRYQLGVRCSGLTVDCVNFTVTDTLPEGFDVTSLPQSTSTRTVTYDEATRALTIVFKQPLQEPPGTTGLEAGGTVNLEIGMRLPADTALRDGTTVTNTATADADNADPAHASTDVEISVPRVVTPVATKEWSDGGAVAGSGEASTVTLGVRNGSSASAQVTSLAVTDTDPDMYENFDVTGVAVTAFPPGANTARLRVRTAAGGPWLDGGSVTAPGPLPLPSGVSAGQVVGVEVVFTNAGGDPLPPSADGGSVEIGLSLRDTRRSDGEPLRTQQKLTVENCATPAAEDAEQGVVAGAEACDTYDILPDTVVLNGAKTFFPDTDGDFTQDNGEYAVLGQNSPVTMAIDVKNNSAFPIKTLSIVEPGTGGEFDKVDVASVRPRFPAGATAGTIMVSYADGTTAEFPAAHGQVLEVAKAGTRATKVEITYEGVDADGEPSIAAGSNAGLDLHGTLNDGVTAADLPGGSSPGVENCAGFEASSGRPDGTGTATGNACKTLAIQEPHTTTQGVKNVGQTSVPPGQPIPFTMTVTNNGNKPLVNPVITDPRAGADGKPDPAVPNPFDSLRVTAVSVTKSAGTPDVTIELYDPTTGTWVPYNGSDAALLERARGARATMNGNLLPTRQFTLRVTTERRDGVGDGVTILNCFSTSAGGDYVPGDPACAPQIETGPVDDSASLNKAITPGQLPEYVPGLPKQYADVTLTLQNTGNMSAKMLQAVDEDTDFFDAVDVAKIQSVSFPAGANRVQIDAYVNGWVSGVPSTTGALPAGVDPAAVTGIRATFTSTDTTTNDGYVITPCAAAGCRGTVVFQVSPRQTLRSSPTTKVPANLADTVNGFYLTQVQDPATPQPIDPSDATLQLVPGTPRLDVDKTPDSVIAPGETAPFRLKVTNTGTANVTGLVVKDTLPAGIAFDETFTGDNGQPFRVVDVQIPTGTPPVPTPTFTATNTGERVSGLSWEFGDSWLFAPGATLTIEFQVTLEPGITAGQTVSNTMGATGSNDDLVCSDPTDGTQADGPFGPGTYCTDTATVTAKAGAAFNARKWVAGNDSLGWYNTRTAAAVPVGDPACPTATGAGNRTYTAYPCVALVQPGDRYHYMLRLVNSGTEPGTHMRIVDRLPVKGDRGVILDQERGTEWNNRPTLASAPTLAGPGALTTRYTDTEPICTKNLDLSTLTDQCAEGDWDTPFGDDVVAAEMDIAFEPAIAPGGRVDVTFDMATPLEIEQVSDPTIAWNSYAHAETTDRGGNTNVLPPTEPIQVGVATAYGSLSLTKTIGQNPSHLPLDSADFTYHVKCVIQPQGGPAQTVVDAQYKVSPDQPMTVGGIPAGAACEIWETGSLGGVTTNGPGNPVKVTVAPGLGTPSVQTVAITNDFPDTVVRLSKEVTGGGAPYASETYPIELTCLFNGEPIAGFPKTVQVEANGQSYETNVPAGAQCSAVETDTGHATEVTYTPPTAAGGSGSGTVTTVPGTPQDITIHNDYKVGQLVVHKDVTGAGAPALGQGPFTFAVACTFNGHDIDRTVTIPKGDGSQSTFTSDAVDALPAGAQCLVTETDSGGADTVPGPVTVTIQPDTTVTAGFTGDNANHFSAGTIGLAKHLSGEAATEPYATNATFTVHVTCQRDAGDGTRTTIYSSDVPIKGGQTIEAITGGDGQAVKLPVGAHCWAEETGTGGATAVEVDHDSWDNAAIVTAQDDPDQPQALMISVTNRFDHDTITLAKTVEGDAASFAADRQFTIAVSCVLPQGAAEPTPIISKQAHTLRGGQTVTIDRLPVGARCWADETDSGGATATTISHGSVDDAAVVGSDTGLSVTNTFDGAALTIGKDVVNGPAGPYTFALACTTDRGPVSLPAQDATFRLAAGERRTVVVPLGARCTVTENDVPKGAAVAYSQAGGAVTVDGDTSVTVTNTFKTPPPVVVDGEGDGPLPRTNGPRVWPLITGGLAAIAGGVLLLLTVRRRKAGLG